jgi:predicted nucleotidyltransferase
VQRLSRALTLLVGDLAALEVDFALIGGLAVSARTQPRFTQDIDVAIAVRSDVAAERVVRHLRERGYTPGNPLEHEESGRLVMVPVEFPPDIAPGITADLCFSLSGVEAEIVGHADLVELPGFQRLPVAQTGHLLVLKLLAGREQDRPDIVRLAASCGDDDAELARRTAELIERRGFHRGKDLSRLVEDSLARAEERSE